VTRRASCIASREMRRQKYPWNRRYLRQPEILAYLKHLVERHDLHKYMQFNRELLSAQWVEETAVWEVKASRGETYWARYFIPAMGVLSKPNFPDIPGIESFKGRITHTSHWLADLDVTNKGIGILGLRRQRCPSHYQHHTARLIIDCIHSTPAIHTTQQ